jgi:ornithine cyclodeaminase/alanine dehydrogenase-like protein (mu-crystallin family)
MQFINAADLQQYPGRCSESEITLFISVGASLENIAAAIPYYESYQQR